MHKLIGKLRKLLMIIPMTIFNVCRASIRAWVVKKFVANEVRPGRLLVCWQDIDKKVYGWRMSADQEVALIAVIEKISETKEEKLREMYELKDKPNQKNIERFLT